MGKDTFSFFGDTFKNQNITLAILKFAGQFQYQQIYFV